MTDLIHTIESKRCEDFFYGTLFNDTLRNNVFRNILEIIKRKICTPDVNISERLNITLRKIENTNLPVLQHSFILFAVFNDKDVQDYVLCAYNNDTEKKKEVYEYLKNVLHENTNKLLNGKFSGIVEYTDFMRYHILTEIGLPKITL